jgi:L-rhamnose mutarotase
VKQYAFTIKLRNDKTSIEEYKRYHASVWPEVKEALRRVGVEHMKTYLLGDRLFTIIEASDAFNPKEDLRRYANSPKVREWDRIMAGLQIPVDEAREGGWAMMELVYDDGWASR